MGYPVDIIELIRQASKMNGSDLHIIEKAKPYVRVYGKLIALNLPEMTSKDIRNLISPILTDDQIREFKRNLELDFSYDLEKILRIRGNIIYQKGSVAAEFRLIPLIIPDMESLGLPKTIKQLCFCKNGLILVTGTTGSGKSTTIASMIDFLSKTSSLNIITLEDPIEFIYNNNKSIISQREVGKDTRSFQIALEHVLRYDPDIIMIGEMRDKGSILAALTAAETGHLVLSTLHTQTAVSSINRILSVFSDDMKEHIRLQLAYSLRAIISQQLVPRDDNNGRILAIEYMVNNPAITNLIKEGKENQLYGIIQANGSSEMQTMDTCLSNLYKSGLISADKAIQYCVDKYEVENLMHDK